MLEALEPVKRAWAAVDVPALDAVKQAWQSTELEGPAQTQRRPSQVGLGGTFRRLMGKTERSPAQRPSSVPAIPAVQPGSVSLVPAVTQVEPWGVGADYDFAIKQNPGTQDIYRELRTTGRPDVGGRPLSPTIAQANLEMFSANADIQRRVDEGAERSDQDPRWVYLRDKAWDFSLPPFERGQYQRELREYMEKRARSMFSRQ